MVRYLLLVSRNDFEMDVSKIVVRLLLDAPLHLHACLHPSVRFEGGLTRDSCSHKRYACVLSG